MKERVAIILLTLLALALYQIPVLHLPFSWLQIYFHELSHGLAAILTGGSIERIQLLLSGYGFCTTQGGIRFIVAWSGYFGAVVWGCTIYAAARSATRESAILIGGTLLAIMGVSTLLWVRDLVTLVIMSVLMGLIALKLRFRHTPLLAWLLRFSGLYVITDAIRSPLFLIDGENFGDGATLSNLTYIPEIVWIFLWEILAWGGLWFLWRTIPATASSTDRIDALTS